MINIFQHANRYRTRQPNDVAEDIALLYHRYNVRTFKFTDEMFCLNRRHVEGVCDAIIATGIANDINIWCYGRVDTIMPDLLAKMRTAGIRWLALGIESANSKVRDGANKDLRNDDVAGVVRSIQDAGINVIANWIFGLPDDDLASMQETLSLAFYLGDFANFYSAMAYPGSALYIQASNEGWNLPETWSGYSQHGYECQPLGTKHLSAPEVLKFRDDAFQRYFTAPGYLDKVLRQFGPETVEHVKRMTEHRLKRRLLGD